LGSEVLSEDIIYQLTMYVIPEDYSSIGRVILPDINYEEKEYFITACSGSGPNIIYPLIPPRFRLDNNICGAYRPSGVLQSLAMSALKRGC